MRVSLSDAFTVLVLLSCLFILQLHGIVFWQKMVGWSGIVWSLLLDAMLIWLWIKKGVLRKLLGVIVCCLTLAGPFYEVGEPMLSEINAVFEQREQALKSYEANLEAQALEKEALKNKIINLEASLKVYQENSQARSGWLPAIEKTSSELSDARKELIAAELQILIPPSSKDGVFEVFGNSIVAVMQIISLALFQIMAVLCLLSLGARRERYAKDKSHIGKQEEIARSISSEDKAVGVSAESDVLSLVDTFNTFMKQNNLTQRAFAEQYALSPRDLSLFKNHAQRIADGKRVVSKKFVDEVRLALEAATGEVL